MTSPRLAVWAPLSPRIYTRRAMGNLPFPLGRSNSRLFSLGRHALLYGLRALGLGPGDQVLVPAYNHGSEITALIAAGVSCLFFGGTALLEPSLSELEELLTPNVRALYLIHYLGFPQNVPEWREWCDARGLLLIEDAAQAWLGTVGEQPIGSFGDLAIFCLYKSFGVPDGAALFSKSVGLGAPTAPGPLGTGTLLKRHAAWLASRSALVSRVFNRIRGDEANYDVEQDFALAEPLRAPLGSTRRLLSRVVDPGAPARRRENYSRLLSELREFVPEPFDVLPAGASPFGFPIAVDDVAGVLTRLQRHDIAASAFWSAWHPGISRAAERYSEIDVRRRTTILLPVHQELTERDLDRMVAAVRRSAAPRASALQEPEAVSR